MAKEIEGKVYEILGVSQDLVTPIERRPGGRRGPGGRRLAVRARGSARRPRRRAGPEFPSRGRAELRRRQEAFDVAWRFLAHRDRTEAEVRRTSRATRRARRSSRRCVAELLEGGYVDDAAFAAPLRRGPPQPRRLGRGADRAPAAELGVDREHDPRRARRRRASTTSSGAACELLARRFPVPPETPRDLERALGFLVRKGYELELAHDALRRHAAAAVETESQARWRARHGRIHRWPCGTGSRSLTSTPTRLSRLPPFPEFPYHPDPRTTGSIVDVDACRCALCGHRVRLVYTGPVFAADDEFDGALCPWCIADGSAALRLGVEFTDVGDDVPADVPGRVLDEITERTPGLQRLAAGALALPLRRRRRVHRHDRGRGGDRLPLPLPSLRHRASPTPMLRRARPLRCVRHLPVLRSGAATDRVTPGPY